MREQCYACPVRERKKVRFLFGLLETEVRTAPITWPSEDITSDRGKLENAEELHETRNIVDIDFCIIL